MCCRFDRSWPDKNQVSFRSRKSDSHGKEALRRADLVKVGVFKLVDLLSHYSYIEKAKYNNGVCYFNPLDKSRTSFKSK